LSRGLAGTSHAFRIPFRRGAQLALLGVLLAAPAVPVRAALADAINAIRLRGCGGPVANRPTLRTVRKLDEAARRTAAGARLHDALLAAGYSAAESAEIHVATSGGDSATAQLLQQHFCAQISEPLKREIVIAQRGADTWIVLAAPLAIPQPEDAPVVSRRVLELVNAARAHARVCGRQSFEATTPLRLSVALGNAALAHSLDMAAHNYFEHVGADGSTPAARVTREGYAWRVVGENLAAGVATADEAVAGWLQSPPHCQNLMDPRFTDMGVAFKANPRDSSVIFWTQVFAQPPPAKARTSR